MPPVVAKFIIYFSSRSSYLEQILAVLEEVVSETERKILIEKVNLEESPERVFSEGVVAVPATDIITMESYRLVGIPQKQDILAILSAF